MKAFLVTASLLVLLAEPAVAKIATNDENVNGITRNGITRNDLVPNTLVGSLPLAGDFVQNSSRADSIGSIELIDIELPH